MCSTDATWNVVTVLVKYDIGDVYMSSSNVRLVLYEGEMSPDINTE